MKLSSHEDGAVVTSGGGLRVRNYDVMRKARREVTPPTPQHIRGPPPASPLVLPRNITGSPPCPAAVPSSPVPHRTPTLSPHPPTPPPQSPQCP